MIEEAQKDESEPCQKQHRRLLPLIDAEIQRRANERTALLDSARQFAPVLRQAIDTKVAVGADCKVGQ